ncbi:beta-1,4-xylosyltransferase IRX14-like [Amaranthus tricolor]|uniref:beta-1,4-xylosyltransferase IRX14-like n=1 Tax=Amaranthus tricolor TaxID=29722 RepID=UPI002585556B|nr:beta-1,4-xylosyltransferase IRX14-like [Amaranthus tricolor]
MKQLSLLQQQATNRRSNSFRSIDNSVDGAIKSPATLFWLILHGLCCLISLILGFRFSRLVFFLLFSPTSSPPNSPSLTMPFLRTLEKQSPEILQPPIPNNRTAGSRVVVGRHGILIRPWPHPNPEEVMRAHRILERVQKEQRLQYGVKEPRSVIVVTPTYVRTFQALHLTGVMHSLMNAPYDVVWIVVEAGGPTNETTNLIAKSGLKTIHVGFDRKMPVTWADRHRVEDLMRVQALRLVRDRKLDGIVVFADDSNMHSMEFFDEVQKVNKVGALSVGILVHSGDPNEPLQIEKTEKEEGSLPVQGPACNLSENLVGWHTFDASPYVEKSAVYIGDIGTILPRKTEWAGFVLNSRLLWNDNVDKPKWMNELNTLADESIESPLSLLKDPSVVEPLGSCGRKVLLWWLRVEARADSKYPSGWVIDTPLEITVPAKHTPWPDIPPELPSTEKVITTEQNFAEEHAVKRPPKIRTKKRSSRGKKKREARVAETQFSLRQQGEQ